MPRLAITTASPARARFKMAPKRFLAAVACTTAASGRAFPEALEGRLSGNCVDGRDGRMVSSGAADRVVRILANAPPFSYFDRRHGDLLCAPPVSSANH